MPLLDVVEPVLVVVVVVPVVVVPGPEVPEPSQAHATPAPERPSAIEATATEIGRLTLCIVVLLSGEDMTAAPSPALLAKQ